MNPYRPASPNAVTVSLGTWAATGEPDLTVTVTVDPRLFSWLVNQAARRSTKVYQVNMGRPPLSVTVT